MPRPSPAAGASTRIWGARRIGFSGLAPRLLGVGHSYSQGCWYSRGASVAGASTPSSYARASQPRTIGRVFVGGFQQCGNAGLGQVQTGHERDTNALVKTASYVKPEEVEIEDDSDGMPEMEDESEDEGDRKLNRNFQDYSISLYMKLIIARKGDPHENYQKIFGN